MKIKLVHILLGMMLGLFLFGLSGNASAGCWVTRGYWSHGYWHPGYRVCNDVRVYHRCGWTRGYYGHYGRWHSGYYRAC